MEQLPSMGRVVIYKHPDPSEGGAAPLSPGIIMNVNVDENDEVLCDVFVMSNTGEVIFAKNVKHGDHPGEWDWPIKI